MRRNAPEVTQALIGGAAVDPVDRAGRTPLFYAALNGDVAIIDLLISHHADVNAKDQMLRTPLFAAAQSYEVDAASRLIAGGAEVDWRDSYGNTSLGRAAFESRGRGDMIKLLLSAGADRSLKNKSGVSPEDLANTIANYDVRQFFG
jgi:ankyrin repeat protein